MPFLLLPHFLHKCLLPLPSSSGRAGNVFETAVYARAPTRANPRCPTVLPDHQTSVWFPFAISLNPHSSLTWKTPSICTIEKRDGRGISTRPRRPRLTSTGIRTRTGVRLPAPAPFSLRRASMLLSLEPELETWDLVAWRRFTLLMHAQFIIFSKLLLEVG